ncbi:hypothetical protein EZV62_017241 [Acer yangbiense]|uniref:Disease resistance N-terminal domain-containing protein n=1 Tax=Acer yangbiense TaxID=1000413 RepID=A0A5C7HGM3_9ROSI|nr:hypothetical protein EZV62_017241 [Acer yangbiense]
MSEKLMAHENENMFESLESKSFSSVLLKPLEDMISSPVVSDFFRRLKLNQKWLNGFKSNLQSLDGILGDAESKAYVNKQVKAWLDELNEVSYDLEDLLDEIFTEELYKPPNRKFRIPEIFSAKLGSLEKVIKRRLKEITEKIENLRSQGNKLGLQEASRIKREPCQLSVGRDRSKDESQVIGRDEDKKDILKMLLSDVDLEGEVFPRLKRIRISQCYKLAKCSPLCLPPSAEVEIYECPLLRDPVTPVTDDLQLRDGNKLQFGSDDKVAGKPPIHPVMEDVQVPNSYTVQLKNEGEIPSQYLEHRTDVLSTSRSSPPESSILSTEMALPKLPVTVEKQLHEGNSRKEKLLERPSTSRLSEVEELQLPDINVMQSTDVSITSSRPPPDSSKHLTEDSSAKHEGALDTSSAATEIPSDTVTDYPINDEGDKAQFRIIDKLDSTSRLQEIEELQLPDSDVVWRTDVSITSSRPPPESSKHLTEDSSAKHEDALDTSSAATEIPSDTVTDDPINDEGDKAQFRRIEKLDSTLSLQEIEELQLPDSDVVWRTDVSTTSNSQPPESSKCLTEDSSAKHVRVSDYYSASTEISSDTDDPINDEGNKVQFRRNEKLLDIPSTSRLQETEELQLPDSNVVQSADVSVTSNRPLPESSKHKTEDSSVEHGGASDNSSASSDTDDPINVWYDEESLEDISSPEQESLNVSEISQLKRLPLKLYSLKIEECKALKSLPEELMHSNLRHLYIIDCQFLKSIQASHLPVPLKTLYIRKCKKLKFLSAEETMGKHTSVEHLCIESSCDPLKSFPLSLFPKLKNLTIWDCVNFNSISITEDHMSLNSLEIRDCTNLESLSKGGLRTPNLTSILLSNCKNLKQLPGQLHELKFLQSLFINECPELDSIPDGGLPSSLNLLRISSCHKLTPGLQWGLHQLNTFSRIEIEGGCRDLESFPEQNLLPRNLNSLQISRFPNLKILNYKGLKHLTSLQTLKINSCDKLQSLPKEGLPSSLSYLYISDCPLLKSKLHNNREDCYVFGDLVHTTSLASFKGDDDGPHFALKDMQLCLETCCSLAGCHM